MITYALMKNFELFEGLLHFSNHTPSVSHFNPDRVNCRANHLLLKLYCLQTYQTWLALRLEILNAHQSVLVQIRGLTKKV